MSLRALRLRCAEAVVWTDGFKAYRTEEKWNEITIEECLHSKLGNFIKCIGLLRCFCPDVLILQREITKMIYSSGRIHSRKFWAPQPYILTFAWWPEPEIWLVVSNAPPRREPSRWDLHLWDQRLQMAWSKDVKNLNRRQKAYWTENARQLAWKPLENKI